MSYTITLTNGTVLTTIPNATLDYSTSLTLLGQNYSGYGAIVAEDFVHLLENFASTSSPPSPLAGQLWYNATTQTIEVWSGSAWAPVGFPVNGLSTTQIGVLNTGFLFENTSCPINEQIWKVSVSNSSPYIGMLIFQLLNNDGSVRNTVMALDGVNNLILGAATYS